MRILVAFILIALTTAVFGGCSTTEIEWSDAGVVIHGQASYMDGVSGQGWIQNDNDFPVRIKQVVIVTSAYSQGETTQWIKPVQPHQKLQQFISSNYGYYILDMNGVEIGWIRPGVSEQSVEG